MADPTLLDLVLRNVFDNALRYSEAGEVRCWLEGSSLLVSDQGPGFVESELERAFDLYYIGPRGTNGLGLALVRHICQASGWQVSAANAPSGGAQISIDLAGSLTISSQIAH
jgi:signal transduction histidine kinase